MVAFAADFGSALLTVEEMYRADTAAMVTGIDGATLMAAAGAAITAQIRARWASRPVAVLCGPGNNGGDGFVVARLLAEVGWPVTVALLGDRTRLRGDAALHAERWTGVIEPMTPSILAGSDLVVDAILGAGLQRPVDGEARAVIEAINEGSIPCVSVDVPSGVDGNTGEVLGIAPSANLTVTFFRKKPGHLLLPGRERAGEVHVADIGIPAATLDDIDPRQFENGPGLWRTRFPWPRAADHKYGRGHALIVGGTGMTGAARLAARAARRVGAGMVTIASGPEALPIYAADSAGLLTSPVSTAEEFAALLDDERKNAVLVGPGAGVNRTTREMTLAALGRDRATVLDADALTVFAGDPETLYAATSGARCLMTPHEGEFRRIFAVDGDKLARTREAAAMCGAVVLLKGADSVIAAPDGRAVINGNAPPELATAGTGDVLAGLALGLMAQGVDPFEAGCAAAWLHGAAAAEFGPGLIAEDLSDMLPRILRRLRTSSGLR